MFADKYASIAGIVAKRRLGLDKKNKTKSRKTNLKCNKILFKYLFPFLFTIYWESCFSYFMVHVKRYYLLRNCILITPMISLFFALFTHSSWSKNHFRIYSLCVICFYKKKNFVLPFCPSIFFSIVDFHDDHLFSSPLDIYTHYTCQKKWIETIFIPTFSLINITHPYLIVMSCTYGCSYSTKHSIFYCR